MNILLVSQSGYVKVVTIQVNNVELFPKFSELNRLCPIELMLVPQIIQFMFIVAKTKGVQHGLQGQYVLVPTDLKKIQIILPRSWDEEYLIYLALKRHLTDKSMVSKQQIRPALVNTTLQKLTKINPIQNLIGKHLRFLKTVP